MILSSSTGGGHNMRAYALKYWWEKNGGEAMVSFPLESTLKLYKFGSDLYNTIQRNCPRLHIFYFLFLEVMGIHRKKNSIFGTKKWIEDIKIFNPEVVVSVHAHLNHGYYQILKEKLNNNFKFFIYCGEMGDSWGFSRHWVNKLVDGFFGPFAETCSAAVKRGMPAEKTFQVEPLLRPAFYKDISAAEKKRLLSKYKINLEKPIYLLGTGANGVNRHLQILSALENSNVDCTVVALCGKNLRIFDEILLRKDDYKHYVLPLKQIDDNEMVFFLKVCDFFFTRPGAGSTTEAVACGTPIIFDVSGGIMPQEKNNLNFWKNRASETLVLKDPYKINKLIYKPIPKVRISLDSYPRKLMSYFKLNK